jgi:hypothetical protein
MIMKILASKKQFLELKAAKLGTQKPLSQPM